jgi:hypothetical protein
VEAGEFNVPMLAVAPDGSTLIYVRKGEAAKAHRSFMY